MSHTISFQNLVPIPSPLSLLPFLSKFPSQKVRLEGLIHTGDEHTWFADKVAEDAGLFLILLFLSFLFYVILFHFGPLHIHICLSI